MITLQSHVKTDRRFAAGQVRIARLWLARAGSTKRTNIKPALVTQSVVQINMLRAKRPLEVARQHSCMASVCPKSP